MQKGMAEHNIEIRRKINSRRDEDRLLCLLFFCRKTDRRQSKCSKGLYSIEKLKIDCTFFFVVPQISFPHDEKMHFSEHNSPHHQYWRPEKYLQPPLCLFLT